MKIERSVIDLEIYGTKCQLKAPTFKQYQQYSESLKALGNDKDTDASSSMKTFLEMLGLPEGIFEQLEVNHIVELMDAVTKKKT